MRLPCLRLQNVYRAPAEGVCVCVGGGGGGGGGAGKGVIPDSSDRDGDRDDRMREKLKTEKNP